MVTDSTSCWSVSFISPPWPVVSLFLTSFPTYLLSLEVTTREFPAAHLDPLYSSNHTSPWPSVTQNSTLLFCHCCHVQIICLLPYLSLCCEVTSWAWRSDVNVLDKAFWLAAWIHQGNVAALGLDACSPSSVSCFSLLMLYFLVI